MTIDEEKMIEEFGSRVRIDPQRFRELQPVIAERTVWLGVHGALCLALRHPQFPSPTAVMVSEFVEQLGNRLVEWGILNDDELAHIRRTERQVQAGRLLSCQLSQNPK